MKFFVFAFLFILQTTAWAASSNEISVTAVGDIMMGTNYPEETLPRNDGRDLFKYSKERIQSADIRFGNFEGTFFDGEKGLSGKSEGANRYLFRTPTRYGQWLAEAGFNVVSLANNHALDFGPEGILSTKETLRQNNIQYSSKHGGEVATFNIRGTRIALIACDYYRGPRSLTTPEKTYQEIRQLRSRYDIVIVSAHAGSEGKGAAILSFVNEIFMGENRGNSVEFARQAIDAGAGLILMHGPHVPRAMEIYKGHLIAYSLGNFLTERGISVQGIAGLAPLIKVDLDRKGKFLRGFLTPFRQIRGYGTIYDKNNSVLQFIQERSTLDFPESAPHFTDEGFFYPN